MKRSEKNVILKGREEGLSAAIIADHVVDRLFDGGSFAVVGNKLDTTLNLHRFYTKRFVYDLQKAWPSLVPPILNETMTSIVFADPETGLAYKLFEAFPSTGDIASSFRFSSAVLDEMAKWPRNIEEPMWWSLDGALTKGARIDIPFTPYGIGGLASEIYHDPKARGFKAFNYTIYEIQRRGLVGNPDHDLEWFADKWRKKGETGMAQEHLGLFIQSGDPVFDRTYLGDGQAPVQEIAGLLIFSVPIGEEDAKKEEEEYRFVGGVDTASGSPSGNWCIHYVMDRTTGDQVAELRGRWKPDVFAARIAEVVKRFPGRHLVESNNHGHAVLLELRHLGVEGIKPFNTKGKGRLNRTTILNDWEKALRNDVCRIASKETISEHLTFVYKGDQMRMEAMDGFHDDGVMAGAICNVARTRPGVGML